MKIAIQGHPTRGKEVIQILEGLGGNNLYMMTGSRFDCYYINNYYSIDGNSLEFLEKLGYKIYTLEKFEKEFPFKIGDRIVSLTTGLIGTITKLSENGMYHLKYDNGICSLACTKYLKLYKEMKEERNITLTLEKAKEWYKRGGELKEVALQAYSEEELTKAELPKSWKEYCVNYPIKEGEYYIDLCSDIILASSGHNGEREIEMDRNICPSKESAEAHLALIQLEQLRDCYRGLFVTIIGMPVWCIIRHKGRLVITQRIWGTNETFLSFQSPEIAEKYLKNFESLIKQAGDLI